MPYDVTQGRLGLGTVVGVGGDCQAAVSVSEIADVALLRGINPEVMLDDDRFVIAVRPPAAN